MQLQHLYIPRSKLVISAPPSENFICNLCPSLHFKVPMFTQQLTMYAGNKIKVEKPPYPPMYVPLIMMLLTIQQQLVANKSCKYMQLQSL